MPRDLHHGDVAERVAALNARPRGMAGNRQDCEVMIDQSRAVDNQRLVRALKPLPRPLLREVEDKLRRLAEL